MTPEQLALGRQRAAATNRRRKEERLARELRERGWTVLSPYEAPQLTTRMAA